MPPVEQDDNSHYGESFEALHKPIYIAKAGSLGQAGLARSNKAYSVLPPFQQPRQSQYVQDQALWKVLPDYIGIMCYVVIVAKHACKYNHPDPMDTVICWRLCRGQAAKSFLKGIWGPTCDKKQIDAPIFITDTAKCDVDARDCAMCENVAQDPETMKMLKVWQTQKPEQTYLLKQEKDLLQSLAEMDANKVSKFDPKYFKTQVLLRGNKEDRLRNAEEIRLAEETSDANENKYFQATVMEGAENALKKVDTTTTFPLYLNSSVSDHEKKSNKNFPRQFPSEASACWPHLDEYGIGKFQFIADKKSVEPQIQPEPSGSPGRLTEAREA